MRIKSKKCSNILPTMAVVLALGCGMGVAPLHAQDDEREDSRWIVRGALLGLFPTGDELGVVTLVPEPPVEPSRNRDISEDLGIGLELEYLVSRKIGLQLGLMVGSFGGEIEIDTGDARAKATDDIGFQAVTLGANYHFTPGKRVDFYGGLGAELMSYDDVTLQFPAAGMTARWTFEDDVGYYAKVGIDVPLKTDSRWVFGAGLSHLRGPLDVKPIILSIGVGYRF